MNKKVVKSTLICPTCGDEFPIMRKENKKRKLYHRKKIYCPACREETNHIEVR